MISLIVETIMLDSGVAFLAANLALRMAILSGGSGLSTVVGG